MKIRLSRIVVPAVAAAALVFGAFLASAETPLTGTWSIEPAREPGLVRLEMRRRSGHSDWSSGETVPIASLVGLAPSVLSGGSSPVRFEIRRDAGNFRFDGSVRDGEGAGHFDFEGNSEYVRAMETMGYAAHSSA